MKTINLDEITNEKIITLSGHERGVQAREYFKIDKIEESSEKVEIIIPDYVITVSSSFLEGMFGEKESLYNSPDTFFQKFEFIGPDFVIKQVKRSIIGRLNRFK